MTDATSMAVLLHGGTPARRSMLSVALREATQVRVRLSSRAAEAAKCLADPSVMAVFLLDDPSDASEVRANAATRVQARHIYELQPRDNAEVVIALVRNVLTNHA